MKPRILIIDDEELTCNLLKTELERGAHGIVFTAHSRKGLPDLPHVGELSLLIVDPEAVKGEALTFLDQVKANDPSLKVIVITSNYSRETVLNALRKGASDFFEKPLNVEAVVRSVSQCLDEAKEEWGRNERIFQLEGRTQRIEGAFEDRVWFVSKAKSMEKVNECLTMLRREAMRGGGEEPSVMIYGENGTGKEGVARMIRAGSRRGKGPWIVLNCSTPQNLEDEFFGHEKGSTPGSTVIKAGALELAQGGTLFLERVECLDAPIRTKLLKAVQEKMFRRVGGSVTLKLDVRFIASTQGELNEEFRRDGFYRHLNQITLQIPPLRERTEDIGTMATQFADHCFRNRGKVFQGFTPGLQSALSAYTWPGNVLELYNAMERMALLRTKQGPMSEEEFQIPDEKSHTPHLHLVPSPLTKGEAGNGAESYTELKKRWCDSFEREYLVITLNKHKGNVSAAAREAKLDRSNFLRLLRRHGLKAQEYRIHDSTPEGLQELQKSA